MDYAVLAKNCMLCGLNEVAIKTVKFLTLKMIQQQMNEQAVIYAFTFCLCVNKGYTSKIFPF